MADQGGAGRPHDGVAPKLRSESEHDDGAGSRAGAFDSDITDVNRALRRRARITRIAIVLIVVGIGLFVASQIDMSSLTTD